MPKPIYESSTQFKHWRFSPEQLIHIRTTLNEAAVKAIKKTLEADEAGSSANVEFINAVEEIQLVKLYMDKIKALCALFRFPEEVEATAVTYLKRFYLKNTVMDWHPKNVMLTTLFLAAKVTNNPISIEGYAGRIPNTSQTDVLELEFLVAQSIGFDFAVHHAHRAMYGLWLDLQSLSEDSSPPQEIYEASLKHVRASRLTDAELIYTPSQIALAALSMVDSTLATTWVTSKTTAESLPTLQKVIADIGSLITAEGRPPNTEIVRGVDRRLRICTNPERIPGTKAFLKKQQEEEEKAQAKRAQKAEEIQRAMEEDDPFGNDEEDKKQRVAAMLDDDDD